MNDKEVKFHQEKIYLGKMKKLQEEAWVTR